VIDGTDHPNFRFILLDVSGKQLQNFANQSLITTIDLSHYPSGSYILRVLAGEKMSYFHIIKK
jgi:hypothetical protein